MNNATYAQIEKNLNEENTYQVIADCKKLIKNGDQDLSLYGNLGLAYLKIEKCLLARKYFNKILNHFPQEPRTLYNLSLTYKLNNQINEYYSIIKKTLEFNDIFFFSFLDLYETLRSNYLISHCKEILKIYKNKIPKSLHFFLETNLTVQNFKSTNEINYFLKKYLKLLEKYNNIEYSKKDVELFLSILNFYYPPTNFFLAYISINTLEYQKKYAQIISKITDSFSIEKNFLFKNKNKKVKVCFASSQFNEHTITKLFKQWILKLNKDKFEISILDLNSPKDKVFNQIAQNVSEVIKYDPLISKNIENIRSKNFNHIIYLDFHMSRIAQILGNFRIANKQSIAWGHPVTSCFQAIDYFLSSELMENEESQKKYSEKLIKLKNLSIFYKEPIFDYNPDIAKKFNKKFINISIMQSMFKLQPKDDEIFAAILTKHKNIIFNFLSGKQVADNNLLKKRILNKLINKSDISRINFLPRANQETFLNYIHNSDFLLDSMCWSGGNTHIEAISIGIPVLTIEGLTLRQNHTCGILKRLDLSNLIAKDYQDYLTLVSKCITDQNFLIECKEKILLNKKKIFNDFEAINSLENFLILN